MKKILFLIFLLLFSTYIYADDIDTKIPLTDEVDTKTFVVVISNENYKNVEDVPFALNDGEVFAAYCEKTLGIQPNHIRFNRNATLSEMSHALQWLENKININKNNARAIFYYSGHGMPSDKSKDAILLPIDGYAGEDETGFMLRELYKRLDALPSKQTFVFLDACFSGADREGKMLQETRGVAIKTNSLTVKNNLVVFSAAQGTETAFPYKEKKHGMFTYFLLKKLNESKGCIKLGDLFEFVRRNVIEDDAEIRGNKPQTPTVVANGDSWKEIRLVKKATSKFFYREASNDNRNNNYPYNNNIGKLTKKTVFANKPIHIPSYAIEGGGTGIQGTYFVQVTITAKKASEITDEELMRAAIHGVLFKGFYSKDNRQSQSPIAGSADAERENADFFNDFFTEDFRAYAKTEYSSRTITKIGKQYQVTATVSVSKDLLRNYLERQEIIRKRLTF